MARQWIRALYTVMIASVLLDAAAGRAAAGSDDCSRLLAAILGPSPLREKLRQLTDEIGGRVTGSAANRQAVAWALEALREAGVESVHTESFTLPVAWSEGETRVEALEPQPFPLRAVSIAWSPPTPPGGVEAPVVDLGFATAEDFDREARRLRGALLLVDRKVLVTWDDLFAEYADALPVIRRATAAGAAGILWISTKEQGVLYRHIHAHGEVEALPQAIVAREDGLRLRRFAAVGKPLQARLELTNTVGGPFSADNVVAEIPGTDLASDIVALGAHLDSWDLGSGALDNGANVALVIEVARAMRAAGVRPRRTLRFLLWNGEEQGLRGSRAYVAAHRDELDRFVAYLNIDGGGGRVMGFAVAGRPEVRAAVEEALAPLDDWDVGPHLLDTYGGSDHVDFLLEGVPVLDVNQPEANYLPNYHASSDTFDKVDLKTLKMNTVVLATAMLGLAQRDEPAGRRLSRAEVEKQVEDTGFDSYLRDEEMWDDFVAGRRGRALEGGQ